jgi:FKBP-type peptidyl-prolyl cis-trans isomerase
MKTAALTVILCMAAAAPLLAGDTNALADDRSKASYALGMMLGHNWQQQGVDVDLDLVLRGIKDEQSGGATLLTPQEAQNMLKEFQQTVAANRAKMQAELASKNRTDGAAFLERNKNQPGIVTLPDGLQYKIITPGTGATPTPNDIVTVNYRGTFIDGTEFDSSAKAGHPAQFPVGGVIHGWTEALLQMKTGSKWQLFIPSELAYGEKGHPGIPPNSVLIFEVELLSVQSPSPQPAPAASMSQPLTSDIISVQGTNVPVIKQEDLRKLQSSQPQ